MKALAALKCHPVPIAAHFDHSLVLAYMLDPTALQPLLPPGLTLDCYTQPSTGRQYAFVAVALVQTRNLRLRALPAMFGRSYFLTGYRIFVRRRHTDGRLLRGLFILRSDTDSRAMAVTGNLLTHYGYRLASIDVEVSPASLLVRVNSVDGRADLDVTADLSSIPAPLPPESPFESPGDARRFAGPMPWTFEYEESSHSLGMVRGRRQEWHPERVAVDVRTCTFLDHAPFSDGEPRLANAFYVRDIDYSWDRGLRTPLRDDER